MLNQNLEAKYQVLLSHLRQFDRIAVAFSGGVDSTFLLYAAKEALGDNVLAVTAVSPIFPSSDEKETRQFCNQYKIQQEFLPSGDLSKPYFQTNPKDRCYHCKKDLFSGIQSLAAGHGILTVAEGSNMDDRNDYRPGKIAIEELGICPPGTSRALPACPPASCTGKPLRMINFVWWNRRKRIFMIWASASAVSGCTG